MPSPFSSLLRSVQADGHGLSVKLLGAGVALLLVWLGWFSFARVPIYATSAAARLVVAEEAHPVEAAVAGRIAAVRMELGQAVKAGDVLVELETTEQQLDLEQSTALLSAFAAQHRALSEQLRVREAAFGPQRAAVEALQRRLSDIAGQRAAEEVHRARVEYALERLRVRAPISGRVGDVAALRVGAQLEAGARLGSVVPQGELKVVADFPPAEAIGWIREGQPALVRLDGFPWTQYGLVAARVLRVASEAREGQIRVECAVQPGAAPAIPLQHGLTGTVEIEVERASPLTLVLRAAGQRLAISGERAR